MFQVLVIKSLKIVPIFIYLFFKMIDFDVKMTDRIFLTNTPSNHKNLHQLVINTFLFLFFQTADVKQRRRAGLLCSDVYFNAGISSGQHSLHACGLFFFFFPSAEIRCGGCRAAAAICRSAAVQPVPQSIGRRAIISQREWLSPAHYIIIISDPSPFTPTPE